MTRGGVSRATLLVHLKILEGVISDSEFANKKDMMETLNTHYKKEVMMLHLN